MDKYVSLHTHSELSMLDGLCTVDEIAGGAKNLGQPAVALTDHGNMCGAPSFYKACRKAEVEPILGEEFYIVDDVDWRPGRGEHQPERYHLVILAKGAPGYQVLAELSTEAHRHYYYKPVLDRHILGQLGNDAQHLVVLSGCAASMLSKAVTEEDRVRQRELMYWYRETFPNFYIELQNHGTDFDEPLNAGLLKLAKKYQVPWVITNDPHYVVPEDDCHHDALLAIQTASDIDDPNRFRFDGTGYHMRTRTELRRAFRTLSTPDFKAAMTTSMDIAELCHTRIPQWESRTWHLPKYPKVPENLTSYKLLRKLVRRGLRQRGLEDNERYVTQAEEELRVFKQVGVSDFLLITWDVINWAKSQGIRVGPGRGSVCGSLVGYLIGLHKIDPLRYNLLFERFLNPARPRMPDVDTDFSQARRSEVFEYTEHTYGRENVVHVCTYQRMRARKAFQSLARAHGIGFQESVNITKQFPTPIPGDDTADDDAGRHVPEEIQERYPELAAQLTRLAGVKCALSTHPAGVIIADPDTNIRQLVPEMYIPNTKRWVGQYDLEAVEGMHLMKQDYLGLRTLDTIDECLKLIKELRGEDVDPDDWVPDEEPGDDEVYQMLTEGRTLGVFQVEGPVVQRGLQAIKCTEFEDIVSATALYRTGPIQAGFPNRFIHNRQGRRDDILYVTPELKPILDPTWGVILYQEQVMDIGHHLAGFDMVQVDDIKEAIKHKKSSLMRSMKPLFVRGCQRNGITENAAKVIWEQIEGYSGYSYNRSHAVAYSMTTYQTARLKCMYPLEFFSALLRTVDTSSPEGKEKRETYMREAVGLGMRFLIPCINESDAGARPTGAGAEIRLGLADYAGIGAATAQKALQGRPEGGYRAIAEVEATIRNSRAMKVLYDGGALRCFGVEGDTPAAERLLAWQFNDPMSRYREKYADEVILPDESIEEEQYVQLVGQIYKVSRGITKNGKPYLTWKLRWSTTEAFDVRLWSETSKHWSLKVGSIVAVQGEWERQWKNISCGHAEAIRVIRRAR